MRLPLRLCAVLSAAAVVLGVVVAMPAGAGADVLPNASKAHPYSDPVWFPLASAAHMECMKDNPGCPPSGANERWTWDIGGKREPKGVFRQKVYAMGAGIAHIVAKNQGCGGSDESRGNSMFIDHGNGVFSLYSHLANFLVHDGDYVSARTPIAHMGNSGYTKCNSNPRVRFLAIVVLHNAEVVKTGNVAGTYVQVKRSYSCVAGARVTWPQALPTNNGTWTRWHDVPAGTAIPDTSDSRPCINTPPATAPHPADAALRKSSAGSLTGTWQRAASQYHVGTVQAQLQKFHPAIGKWLDAQVHTLSGGATSTRFTSLTRGEYRMRVWFKNGVGWSAPTRWQDRVLS